MLKNSLICQFPDLVPNKGNSLIWSTNCIRKFQAVFHWSPTEPLDTIFAKTASQVVPYKKNRLWFRVFSSTFKNLIPKILSDFLILDPIFELYNSDLEFNLNRQLKCQRLIYARQVSTTHLCCALLCWAFRSKDNEENKKLDKVWG